MGLNLSLFDLLHGFAGQSSMLDFLGVFFANYLPYILGGAVLVFIFKRKSAKERVFLFVILGLSALLARGLLTELFHFFYSHARPFDTLGFTPLIQETGNSFPSAHAALLFSLAAALWYFDKRWGWWFLGFSLLNGVARVFAGVHWPFDILGGMALGILSAAAVIGLLMPYMPRTLLGPTKEAHGEPPAMGEETG